VLGPVLLRVLALLWRLAPMTERSVFAVPARRRRPWHPHCDTCNLPFVVVLDQYLQEPCSQAPLHVDIHAWRWTDFENPYTQVNVSTTATSGRTNLSETTCCCRMVP